MSEEKIKAREILEFGVRITIFENGDVYISTRGDIHILDRKNLFDETKKRGEEMMKTKKEPIKTLPKCFGEPEPECVGKCALEPSCANDWLFKQFKGRNKK